MNFLSLDFAEPHLVIALHELVERRPPLAAHRAQAWDRLVALTRATDEEHDGQLARERSTAHREWQSARTALMRLNSKIRATREAIEKAERRAQRAAARAAREI